MLEYIYICRHGFRSNWVDPTIKTGPTKMPRDPPLAAYGENQASLLADFISSPEKLHPYPLPELVFSSPFYRCIQTAVPTFVALNKGKSKSTSGGVDEELEFVAGAGGGKGVKLEHGVQEWYSPVNPSTGLHPRPAQPTTLAQHFPKGTVDTTYTSTYFPSRYGESLKGLHTRAQEFLEAWIGRVEGSHEDVKCVVIFAHAASVIALGRALTGNKSLEVTAGCASTSLYRRLPLTLPPPTSSSTTSTKEDDNLPISRSTTSLNAANGLLALSKSSDPLAHSEGSDISSIEGRRIACWEILWNGRADYMPRGVERDWSFRDVELKDGEVINDNGDFLPHTPEDALPEGLGDGMERYLPKRTDRSKI